MLARAALILAVSATAACNKTEGGDVGPPPSSGATKGSAGGFSADLAAELAADPTAKPANGDSKPAAGSAVEAAGTGSAAAGSAAAAGGSAAGGSAPAAGGSAAAPAAGGSAAAAGGSAAAPSAGGSAVADAKPGDPRPTARPVDSKPAPPDTKPVDSRPAPPDTKPVAPTPAVAETKPAPPIAPPPKPVKMTPELSAIKLSLLPNWDRDVDEPATFQYVVRIKGTQATKTFAFHYGYDDPKAPADREAYKKYLQDTRLMTGEIKDRQRGGAWFLEGADVNGSPAFRYVVLYGGKRLICYGSLYKDADSNRLGDDRDQTIIQAKQICETLAL